MTEEEAKTKWCPFVRLVAATETQNGAWVGSNAAPAFNRLSVDGGKVLSTPHTARCIGSACMAWRLSDRRQLPSKEQRWQEDRPVPNGEQWTRVAPGQWERPVHTVLDGFCGLAGQ